MIGLGVRRHLLKMDDTSIPEARKIVQKYYYLDVATKSALIAILAAVIFGIAKTKLEDVDYCAGLLSGDLNEI